MTDAQRAVVGLSEDTAEQVRVRIAKVCREIAARGVVVGGAGNVSERAGDMICITRTGLRFEKADPADVCVISTTGQLVEGTRPSSETILHLGVYRNTDARAIVHIHGKSSVAVGLVRDQVPLVHYNIRRLGGCVPTVAYAPFGSTELAQSVSQAMVEGAKSVLLRNHGSVSQGKTLDEAVEFIEMTEWLCDVYLSAYSLGPPALLSEGELAELADRAAATGYGTSSDTTV